MPAARLSNDDEVEEFYAEIDEFWSGRWWTECYFFKLWGRGEKGLIQKTHHANAIIIANLYVLNLALGIVGTEQIELGRFNINSAGFSGSGCGTF